ncbi:MAG TPA: hypothetical protein VMU74_08540 [Gaiellaceae bacterium]|nr:hypothetical protein [Gaiellaceae bacterium]
MRNSLRILVVVLVLAAPAAAAPSAGPVNRALPLVVGTARVGEQITGTNGTWAGTGTISYTYRWDRCDAAGNGCAQIAGASRLTYLSTPADLGKTLGLVVTAKNASGSAVADAGLIGPIAAASALADIGRPFVSGTATVGATLTATAGVWTKTPTAVTYSWLRCNAAGRACVAIAGAAASSYLAASADTGHTLVARLQGTVGTASQVVLSIPTGLVAAGSQPTTTSTTTTTPAPGASASTRPAITGTVRVGQRLTGTTAGATAYQWYRCDATGAHCSSVHGATKATYTTVAKDVGHTLGLTAEVNGAPVYASLVGPVAAASALASTVQPALSGKPVQGQTLNVTPGTWTSTTASVSYVWERCNANGRICSPIVGASTATYVPVTADVGHAVAALVTATATAAGKTQETFSVASDGVVAPPALAATTAPAVTGTLKIGQQLSGTTGQWTGTAPIAYAFQWYRCDAAGAHCSSVRGATKPTYRLVKADAGKTIGFTVTATDATSAKQPAYASLVGLVAASSATLVSTAQPKLVAQGQALTADAGLWTATPTSVTYQWERCNANGRICAPIAGAASASYTLTSADSGHELVVLVAAHAGSATASALSDGATAP